MSLNLYLLLNNNVLTIKIVEETTEKAALSSSVFDRLLNTTTKINIYNNTNNYNESYPLLRDKRSTNLFVDKYELKQSYLTLQIIAVFIFFIYFILNNLIKLQLKYHSRAIRKNKYSYRNSSNQENTVDNKDDEEEEDEDENKIKHDYSFSTSFSSSHYSSSINSGRTSKFKRIFKIVLSKFSSSLLYFFYGYQYCQNTFLTDITALKQNIN